MFLIALSAMAQMMDPVHFTSQLKLLKEGEAELVFSATIDPGWHVYSTNLGNDGPIAASFNTVKMEGAEPVGKLQARGSEIKKYDKLFDMELRYFEKAVTFVQKIRFTKPQYDIDCYVEYGACNDEACLPPSEASLKAKGKSPVATEETKDAKVKEEVKEDVEVVEKDTIVAQNDSVSAMVAEGNDLWQPVVDELKAMGGSDNITDHSLLYILLMGFIGGLLAVCMPCIWPIIPMTVSFFLKRAKTDKKTMVSTNRQGIKDAIAYGLSIIVIYLGLGLLVTALFGSDTLNAMSTNAVFNIFLFVLLVVFALSFFGWFEIKLPDSWANAVYTKASTTSGLLSIFSHHRTVACRNYHQRQLARACPWHVWFRTGLSPTLHALCPVPSMAETSAEVGLLDEHAEDCAGLHRTGVCSEILLGGRPCLWMALVGP